MDYEILSPAGNMEKLKTAIHFGANAVYFSGKLFGLRAFAGNFTNDEIVIAVNYCHEHNVKAYVTVNIVAHNRDFIGLKEYLEFLQQAKVDGVIVADLGVASFVKKYAPNVQLHISTQANVTNKYTAKLMADFGASRIVLARELCLSEIKEIREFLPENIQLECFVHGAMCISYSGRCLLSNYLSNRSSNMGQCVQACRWKYTINEYSRDNEKLVIEEDKRGTYILNSKDLNMINYLPELMNSGVYSFKIEGRMKSAYYVATVVNAYKRAVQFLENNKGKELPDWFFKELEKTSNRGYTTGFYFKDKKQEESECLSSSEPVQTHDFVAVVVNDAKDGLVCVQQRNRFKVGDELEVLSPTDTFNKILKVEKMYDENMQEIVDAKNVQQKIFIQTDLKLIKRDILRIKIIN